MRPMSLDRAWHIEGTQQILVESIKVQATGGLSSSLLSASEHQEEMGASVYKRVVVSSLWVPLWAHMLLSPGPWSPGMDIWTPVPFSFHPPNTSNTRLVCEAHLFSTAHEDHSMHESGKHAPWKPDGWTLLLLQPLDHSCHRRHILDQLSPSLSQGLTAPEAQKPILWYQLWEK